MMKMLVQFYASWLLNRPDGGQVVPEHYKGLPITISELEREIARQDDREAPHDADDAYTWILTRCAMAEIHIQQFLKRKEISLADAELLRKKHFDTWLKWLEQAVS